jgi:Carboxypeptidase regulatory-like domain
MFSLWPLLACAAVFAPQQPAIDTPMRVEGIVVGLDRQLVPACEVWIEDGAAVHRGTTDGSGRFVLVTERRQFVQVRARLPGKAAGSTWAAGTTGAPALLRVELLPCRPLHGVVRDGAGAVVPGAFVSAVPADLPGDAAVCASATTGADGRYRLDEVVLGKVAVHASAPGLCAATADAAALQQELDLQLDDFRPRQLQVTVADANPQQLASAVIRLFGECSGIAFPLPPYFAEARLASDGVCRLSGLPEKVRLHVEVTVPGAVVAPAMDFVPTDSSRWHCRFRVLAAPPPPLRGRVVDQKGNGVAGVRVLAVATEAMWQVRRPAVAVSGGDGSFELLSPVPAGDKVSITLLDPQWVVTPSSDSPDGARIAVHDPACVQQVSAEPALHVRAHIVGADGHPVAGAEAMLWSDGHGFGSATADAGGNLRLVGACIGMSIAEPAGGGTWHFEPPSAGELDLGTLRLDVGAAVCGRAVDRDGVAVPGARVYLNSDSGEWSRLAVADVDGAYAFAGLPAGIYFLGGEPLSVADADEVTKDLVVR